MGVLTGQQAPAILLSWTPIMLVLEASIRLGLFIGVEIQGQSHYSCTASTPSHRTIPLAVCVCVCTFCASLLNVKILLLVLSLESKNSFTKIWLYVIMFSFKLVLLYSNTNFLK